MSNNELFVILAIHAMKECSGLEIKYYIQEQQSKDICIGALYSIYDRLVRENIISQRRVAGGPERGGRDKLLFSLTDKGTKIAVDNQDRFLNPCDLVFAS